MARRSSTLQLPRIIDPELPDVLDDAGILTPRMNVVGVQLDLLTGQVHASHSSLAESLIPSARLNDVLFDDCEIGTLDLPEAQLSRVQFLHSRADEVDTRGLHAADLDLRGLEALSFTDPRGLAGGTLSPHQAQFHSAAFARTLGIHVEP
ncbi:MAG: hypothetical protein ABS62_06420 [Microbacterium sp. SCN 70-200]|uniref:hypothetical protein n=1 Tax=unclassified Microbacterium TaxID=2609290 RepID=UPI00086F72DF|nr:MULTISPECIES: hypothetical protein [unclassified Microbacterium]MBN9214581.1 hypothetical protein [Microbacterium sp.]ODT41473.1 MAG: hypothetical protein ABS62_06420 [Microbacterium sp. SCN 70-200]OJV84047.1 MAG: hypothetical protein BGO46_13935 [Microbacterium sp. 70-16]